MVEVRNTVLGKATVTSKGQLTIPAGVRRAIGIHKGDRLVFEVHPDGILLRRALRASDLVGAVPPIPGDWKAVRRKAWAERAKRLAEQRRAGSSSVTPTSSSGS